MTVTHVAAKNKKGNTMVANEKKQAYFYRCLVLSTKLFLKNNRK